MKEIVLNKKKNGLPVVLLTILLYVCAILLMILAADRNNILLIAVRAVWLSPGWIPLCGLKAVGPHRRRWC